LDFSEEADELELESWFLAMKVWFITISRLPCKVSPTLMKFLGIEDHGMRGCRFPSVFFALPEDMISLFFPFFCIYELLVVLQAAAVVTVLSKVWFELIKLMQDSDFFMSEAVATYLLYLLPPPYILLMFLELKDWIELRLSISPSHLKIIFLLALRMLFLK
jgi:hypothetical protein